MYLQQYPSPSGEYKEGVLYSLTLSHNIVHTTLAWFIGDFFRLCVIWVFPLQFTSVKKITESSVIFLRDGVLIINWKENKEAGAICFELRIPRK